FNKGPTARITSQAEAYVKNLELGGGVSLSFFGLAGISVELAEAMDLIMGVTGVETDKTRLSHLLLGIHMRDDGASGTNRLDIDARAQTSLQSHGSLMFGLIKFTFYDIKFPGDIKQPIDLFNCDAASHGPIGSTDELDTGTWGSDPHGEISLGFPHFDE